VAESGLIVVPPAQRKWLMFEYWRLEPSGFRFAPNNDSAIHNDRMRGMITFGPYRTLSRPPTLAFVFPEGYRDAANQLYLGLRNGVGPFPGIQNLFRVKLERDQVQAVTGFSLPNRHNHHDSALRYKNAVENWVQNEKFVPDIFINLHPRSMGWEEDSPYAATKAVLLKDGLLSQNVTFDLLSSSNQFQWAIANIALAIFVKLGGIPWVVNRPGAADEVVIGMGRSESFDVRTRARERTIAFTTCLRSNGIYEFSNFGRACSTQEELLQELKSTLRQTLAKLQQGMPTKALTIHFPKEFSFEERETCRSVLTSEPHTFEHVEFVKVSEEERFFAIDDEMPDYVPRRGTCIRLSSTNYLLYTEGSEERQGWLSRHPSAVRISHERNEGSGLDTRNVVSQVYDLSLTNWRAFNAQSHPVSILYSNLISRILRSAGLDFVGGHGIENRMWFL
jgi:argonaute-like protein implicated in RNA metabolism and viral defense